MEIQQQIIDFLQKSRYFPVAIEDIAKITGKRNNFLTPVLTDMVKNKQLVTISTESYFHPANFSWLEERLLDIVKNFHKNYPYLEGIKKGDIRKAVNNKKGQQNLHDLIFENTFENLLNSGKIVASGCYFKLHEQCAVQDACYLSHSKTILSYFNDRQDLNKIHQLCTLANDLKIDSRHLRNIMDALIKEGRIIRISETIYLGRNHLLELQGKISQHIQINGVLTTLEAKELFMAPRKTTVAILEYFDELGITRREESNRVLI